MNGKFLLGDFFVNFQELQILPRQYTMTPLLTFEEDFFKYGGKAVDLLTLINGKTKKQRTSWGWELKIESIFFFSLSNIQYLVKF